ncbi:MAG TPA: lytic murein transglycosylase, partial [Candidatus Saccharimonadia bacterium]|nr:lytic murein transglycosylase [Candidatus Saccharimonadia bacterium]
AVHSVESGQSGDTTRTSSAGATGPMQFIPATFYAYAAPGQTDIDNTADAVLAAGRYLAAGGAARGDYQNALYHYNHSWDYVDHVMAIADSLGL